MLKERLSIRVILIMIIVPGIICAQNVDTFLYQSLKAKDVIKSITL